LFILVWLLAPAAINVAVRRNSVTTFADLQYVAFYALSPARHGLRSREGKEFFNRPLYGTNTAFRVDAGDRPETAAGRGDTSKEVNYPLFSRTPHEKPGSF